MQPSILTRADSRRNLSEVEYGAALNGEDVVVLGGGLERRIELCECMLDIASAMFNVSGRDLRRPGRSTLEVSRVRQIAMYVSHVVLRLSMTDIGTGFGRDRTTVIHACHVVEDLRDDEDFDAIVVAFERVAGAALRYRGSDR